MIRLLLFFSVVLISFSCSKSNKTLPAGVIPDVINGIIKDMSVTPVNLTTPGTGTFTVFTTGIIYTVEFNAVSQAQSNATLSFDTDSVLRTESREFANLGKDAIAYSPVGPNELIIRFHDGKKIIARFDANSSFGGVFGEQQIVQWRTPGDPAKPNQKAQDDIKKFVRLYADADGSGPGSAPVYLFVQVTSK